MLRRHPEYSRTDTRFPCTTLFRSLAYQPQLGAAWFRLGDIPVYRPWSLFAGWDHFDAYAPVVFDKAGALAAASGFVGCAAAIFGSLWRARQSRQVTTYG